MSNTQVNQATIPSAMKCDDCGGLKNVKFRYCKRCSESKIKEMEKVGYLEPIHFYRNFRSYSAREVTHETKFGIDH